MTIEFVKHEENNSMKLMAEDEWIDVNLKLICENNGKKVIFVSRKGGRANKNDRAELALLFEKNDLGLIGTMKSSLSTKGKLISSEFECSWLKYLEFIKEEERIDKGKASDLEKLEVELKKSTIKVNNLTVENSEQTIRIAGLAEKNLKLQNKKLKRDITIGIIAFISSAIVTNIKDILIFLERLF